MMPAAGYGVPTRGFKGVGGSEYAGKMLRVSLFPFRDRLARVIGRIAD